jgi:hypothetical protein
MIGTTAAFIALGAGVMIITIGTAAALASALNPTISIPIEESGISEEEYRQHLKRMHNSVYRSTSIRSYPNFSV